ncbi:PhzF family phenazine biosynthesis isomerase, partial [Serratia marcescens]
MLRSDDVTPRAYKQVDVFTRTPLQGNPVAVVLEAEGLSSAQMLALARWTNLSETTFVLKPTHPAADYKVRIFTTEKELPFAGHPTLGTAHALLEAGLTPKRPGTVMQECGVGLVAVDI